MEAVFSRFAPKLILVIISFAYLGCAVTPESRFPNAYKQKDQFQSIDLVVDVLVASDIKGKDIGIDRSKQQTMIDAVVSQLTSDFDARGINLTLVHSGYGLLFEPASNEKYVISEDGIASDELFESAIYQPQESPWGSKEAIAFLKAGQLYAPLANDKDYPEPESPEDSVNQEKSKKVKKKKRRAVYGAKPKPKPLVADEFPLFLDKSNNRYVMFAQAKLFEVPTSKVVGSAIFTGLLSAALTGGMYVYSSAPATGTEVDLILFDTQKKRIIWQNSAAGNNDLTHASNTVKVAASPFPGKPSSAKKSVTENF